MGGRFTMAIRLRLENYQSKIPIRVGGVLPQALAESPLDEIKRRSIWIGKAEHELGELFDVQSIASPLDDHQDPGDPGLTSSLT